MQGIEIARADEPGSVRARALRVEFGLGALVRGEWRVSEARVQGPEISAGLDENGEVTGARDSASIRKQLRSSACMSKTAGPF